MKSYYFIFIAIACMLFGFGFEYSATNQQINKINAEHLLKLENELQKCQKQCITLAEELDRVKNKQNKNSNE